MTDKELKAKIIAEIERQIELNNNIDAITTAQQLVVDSVNVVLVDLVTFINSIPEEPVSEDLGEIVLEGTNFNKSWYAHPELAFKAGANWQKEQMMKETVEVEVWDEKPPHITYFPKNLKGGDRVKLIIVKE